MGLFGKKQKKEYRELTFKIYMNHSGSSKDETEEITEVKNESEFMAVVEAEKRFPKLRVFKVERV